MPVSISSLSLSEKADGLGYPKAAAFLIDVLPHGLDDTVTDAPADWSLGHEAHHEHPDV